MKRILAAWSVALLCSRGASGDFSYQSLDYPGATNTWANGIDGNVVVGMYATTSMAFPYHGFVYDGSSYTTLDYPGARSTVLTDIDGGRIVGDYADSMTGRSHGFIYQNGVFTTVDDPLVDPNSGNGTELLGISGNKVVGVYIDTSSVTHGFVYDGTIFTTLTTPYSASSTASAIDGNTILGSYFSGGYKFDGATYSKFNSPQSINTVPLDILGQNVVGYYVDAASQTHGFCFDGTAFTKLNEPSSLGSQFIANGISGSILVGQYLGAGARYHGFFTVQVPEPALIGLLLPALLLFTTGRPRVCA